MHRCAESTLIYGIIFLCMTLIYWGLGEVVSPHRQYAELGLVDHSGARQIENRIFTDFTQAYIPEVSEHLNGTRAGWLKLWTNQTELGRPIHHLSGFSPAYLPAWIIAQLTRSPWQFLTILAWLNCFLAGLFIILFCREKSLSPLAGLIAGTSLMASPFFMWWLTFPMFTAVWCWAAGALWAMTRLARQPDGLGWSMLAFSTYSLLMTANPQSVIFQAYILTAYGLYLTYYQKQKFILMLASAVSVGALCAMPVYLDLIYSSANSARLTVSTDFFTAVLPKFSHWTEAVSFLVTGTMPNLFGNPISVTYPLAYNGLSVTPIVIFFTIVSLLAAFRKTWGWWLAAVLFFILAFSPALYIIGVNYFGFNLSRCNPLGNLLLPITVIIAYGVDALTNRQAVIKAGVSVIILLASGLLFGWYTLLPIAWSSVIITLAVVFLLLTAKPLGIITALALVLASMTYPLTLHQNPKHIATSSPLVDALRANLSVGSRFAIVAPGLIVLPPNLNAALDLPSVHSYNSLSSKHYHQLIRDLGGQVATYGRWNSMINPDYNSEIFQLSNISLILSPKKISHPNLKYLSEISGVHLYQVLNRITILAEKTRDQTDKLEFKLNAKTPPVLTLSQKYHRDWQALAWVGSQWVPAKTTVVKQIFQGVIIPLGAEKIRLEFKPYSRYAWLAHIFWLGLLGVNLWQFWRKRHV